MAEETFTTNLQLSKPDVGGQNNVWGGSLNTDFDFLDDHVAGYLALSVAGAVDVTLTEAQFRHKTFKFTGVLTASINVIVPAREFAKRMENATTGAFTLTVKTSAGSGVAITQGKKAFLTGDATNVALFLEEGASLASTTEVLTGTSAAKTVTPDALAALWEKGSDVASATTVSLGEGGFFHITGTTTITDIDFATDKSGRAAWLVFDGALTLTHHGTTLILPTGANIVTEAGDAALVVSEDGSNNVRVPVYLRKSGKPLFNKTAAINSPSDNYTLALGDADNILQMNKATALNLTVPPNSSVAFPVGTEILVVQLGAGQLTFVEGLGVTINSSDSKKKLFGRYSGAVLYQRATDFWVLIGDLVT